MCTYALRSLRAAKSISAHMSNSFTIGSGVYWHKPILNLASPNQQICGSVGVPRSRAKNGTVGFSTNATTHPRAWLKGLLMLYPCILHFHKDPSVPGAICTWAAEKYQAQTPSRKRSKRGTMITSAYLAEGLGLQVQGGLGLEPQDCATTKLGKQAPKGAQGLLPSEAFSKATSKKPKTPANTTASHNPSHKPEALNPKPQTPNPKP